MTKYIRWYVNIAKWKPTREEWLKITSSVANEEMQRINKFAFQDDAKTSLIGRAMIREFVSHVLDRPTNELRLTRTEFGRPVISNDYKSQLKDVWPKVFDFNISHSGDFCVLVGVWSYEECPNITVGVDVTKIVSKKSKPELDRFLSLMSRREFTASEWEIVEKVHDDRQKCINFTRLWCLKESFIKSIGLGLSFKLHRISFEPDHRFRFHLNPHALKNVILDSTKVLLDGRLADDWFFHETALDDQHLVAIGYNVRPPSFTSCDDNSLVNFDINTKPFQELTINILMDGLTSITEPREENWNSFSLKLSKPQ